jgi:polyisoprenoid-binding protein YceI
VRAKALLNSGAHPEIAFVARSVTHPDGTWAVCGTVTVRGRAAPRELAVTVTVERPEGLTIVATGSVDRYAHGVAGARGFVRRRLELTITAVTSNTA